MRPGVNIMSPSCKLLSVNTLPYSENILPRSVNSSHRAVIVTPLYVNIPSTSLSIRLTCWFFLVPPLSTRSLVGISQSVKKQNNLVLGHFRVSTSSKKKKL